MAMPSLGIESVSNIRRSRKNLNPFLGVVSHIFCDVLERPREEVRRNGHPINPSADAGADGSTGTFPSAENNHDASTGTGFYQKALALFVVFPGSK